MLDRFLRFAARLAFERPWTVVICAAVLTGITGGFAAFKLGMNANTDDLIASERPYMQTYRRFLERFGDLEFIHLVVTSDDPRKSEECVDRLTERLREIPEFPGVFSGIEPAEQLRIAVSGMSENELAELAAAAEAIPELTSGKGAAAGAEAATAHLKRLINAGLVMREEKQRDVGAAAFLLLFALAAADPESAAAVDLATLTGNGARREYLRSDNQKLYFINVMPVKDYGTMAVIEKPLQKIRDIIGAMKMEFPSVEIGLTGKPVLQADEMSTTNDDMILASILGLILTALPFMLVIGGIVRPMLAVGAFACGIAWTFGLAAVTLGQLNLLSVVFVPILVGIGLDFGVHIVVRYLEERTDHDVRESVEKALLTSGRGNITGALTQCAAFYTALFTNFQGLRELGFVAGSGLVICLLSITMILPALLVLHERKKKKPETFRRRDETGAKAAGPFQNFILRRPGTALMGAVVVTMLMIGPLFRLDFQENLLELQAKDLDSVKWERRIMENSKESVWFAALTADTEEKARDLVERAKKLPSVETVHSAFDVAQPMTPEREKSIGKIRAALEKSGPASAPANRRDLTSDDLHTVARLVKDLAQMAKSRAPEESERLTKVAATLTKMARELVDDDPKNPSGLLSRIEATYAAVGRSLASMTDSIYPKTRPIAEILPRSLEAQFTSKKGGFLVMAHPKEDIWDAAALAQFVKELRTVDPETTGPPVTHYESIKDMKQGFYLVALYSVLVVLLLVYFDFRSVRGTLLAALPLFVGLLWTVGTMGAVGIDFNLANFFAAPILIGICVDNGVHILHRYREGGPFRLTLASTRRAIILTSINNVFGFGCMATAAHRGLRSLGLVMALGAFFCMVSSLAVLPPLLAWLEKRRGGNPSISASHRDKEPSVL